MKNWKARSKIMLGMLSILFILSALSTTIIILFSSTSNIIIRYSDLGQESLLRASTDIMNMRRMTGMIHAFAGNEERIEGYNDDFNNSFTATSNYLDDYILALKDNPLISPQEFQQISSDIGNMKELLMQYKTLLFEPNVINAKLGNVDALIPTSVTYGGLITEVSDGITKLITNSKNIHEKAVNDVQFSNNTMIIVFITVSVLVFAGVLFFSFYISGLISKPLQSATKSLYQLGKKIESVVNQVTDSASVIAESSNEQAAAIEETSATMNETSSMLFHNAENTRQAVQLAHHSKENADRSKEKMRDMIKAMNQLKESSYTISKILKTIDDLAFQTNLLAINATVEAARAGGDSGRSFAVVAEEVRNLASKSSKSASDTAEIIDKNIALANSGDKTSQEVAKSLESIANQFAQLDRLIGEINAASEEQNVGVKQINVAINQIEKSTQSNAAVSNESAASASMLKDMIKDLGKISNDIHAVANGNKKV